MGFYADTLARIQAAITARMASGEVESYSLPDGTDIKLCSLETLFSLEEKFSGRAQEEAGGRRFRLARLRPRE